MCQFSILENVLQQIPSSRCVTHKRILFERQNLWSFCIFYGPPCVLDRLAGCLCVPELESDGVNGLVGEAGGLHIRVHRVHRHLHRHTLAHNSLCSEVPIDGCSSYKIHAPTVQPNSAVSVLGSKKSVCGHIFIHLNWTSGS